MVRSYVLGMGLLLSAALLAGCGKSEKAAVTSPGHASPAAIASEGSGPAANVTTARIVHAASEPGEWMT
ncbi:MAG: hypothetical protein ACRET2_14980, partial [Steroidobacteraceae bacterium]